MKCLVNFCAGVVALAGTTVAAHATPVPFDQRQILVQHSSGNGNTSQGYYNNSLGQILNGTNPFFPCDYQTCGDPTNVLSSAPTLSAAAQNILGDWLNNPGSLNSNWSLRSIPTYWNVNDEDAIVYAFDIGATGWTDVELRFGVDNGALVWLDGQFVFGAQRGGGAYEWEYSVNLPDLGAGTHYLQILREDHGGATGYALELRGTPVSAVSEPGTLAMFGLGLAGIGAVASRRKRA
jgi:hypothetical protein